MMRPCIWPSWLDALSAGLCGLAPSQPRGGELILRGGDAARARHRTGIGGARRGLRSRSVFGLPRIGRSALLGGLVSRTWRSPMWMQKEIPPGGAAGISQSGVGWGVSATPTAAARLQAARSGFLWWRRTVMEVRAPIVRASAPHLPRFRPSAQGLLARAPCSSAFAASIGMAGRPPCAAIRDSAAARESCATVGQCQALSSEGAGQLPWA